MAGWREFIRGAASCIDLFGLSYEADRRRAEREAEDATRARYGIGAAEWAGMSPVERDGYRAGHALCCDMEALGDDMRVAIETATRDLARVIG